MRLSEEEIDNQLFRFAQDLKTRENVENKGKDLAKKLFDALVEDSHWHLVNYKVVGSYGKNTAILEPDLDIVVEVSLDTTERHPPMKGISKHFLRILRQQRNRSRFQIQSFFPYKDSIGFRVTFFSGLNVDILPAVHMDKEDVFYSMQECYDNDETWIQFSNSLLKDQIKFVTSFTGSGDNAFFRLCKLWFRSIHFTDGKFIGGNMIMEMVAAAAFQQVVAGITQRFLRVLEMMETIDSLKLAFEKQPETGKWTFVARRRLHRRHCFGLIPWVVGKKSFLKRTCFIIDPTNPYNDLLWHDENRRKFETIKKSALVTKFKISELYTGKYIIAGRTISFWKLFKPQPFNFEKLFPYSIPDYVRVHYCYKGYGSLYSCVQKNGTYKGSREKSYLLISLRKDLIFLVKTVIMRVKNTEPDIYSKPCTRVKRGVAAEIRRMVRSSMSSAVVCHGSSDDAHESMDATIYIPYQIDGNSYAVRFSMSWD